MKRIMQLVAGWALRSDKTGQDKGSPQLACKSCGKSKRHARLLLQTFNCGTSFPASLNAGLQDRRNYSSVRQLAERGCTACVFAEVVQVVIHNHVRVYPFVTERAQPMHIAWVWATPALQRI